MRQERESSVFYPGGLFSASARAVCLTVIISVVMSFGCGPRTRNIVSQQTVCYFVPRWKKHAGEQKTLISSLAQENTLFIYEYPHTGLIDTANSVSLPEGSCIREMKDMSLLFIRDRSGVPPVPPLWKTGNRPECPLAAFITGDLPPDVIKRIHTAYSPDAYVFIRDHYEKMADISSSPAASAGTGTLDSPFTGDFPYILQISMTRNSALIRPVDIEGYILKPDTVTSASLSGLKTLKKLLCVSLVVKGWETSFTRTVSLSVPNPFSDPLCLTIEPRTVKDCLWRIKACPVKTVIEPGRNKTVRIIFSIEDTARSEPFPEFRYSLTVGSSRVFKKTVIPDVTYLPSPGT